VAPLFEAGSTGRDVYLPPGQWIDYQTGHTYAAGWHRIEAGRIPVVMLVRDGAVIPHIALAQSTMQMDWTKLDLVVFASGEKAEGLVCLPSDRVLRKVSLAKKGGAFAAAENSGMTVKLYSAAGIPGLADSH
jgi:alpha-D-xyloside xylohydrolase